MKLNRPQITMTTAHAAFTAVDAAIAAGDTEIDLTGVTHADSSLVALLLHANRGLKARGLALRVTHAPETLHRFIAVYGIESLFDGTLV